MVYGLLQMDLMGKRSWVSWTTHLSSSMQLPRTSGIEFNLLIHTCTHSRDWNCIGVVPFF